MTPQGNARGIALMCASMAAFTFNDACMKVVTQDMPLMQAIGLRGGLTTLLLIGFARFSGGARLPGSARDRRLLGLRTLAEMGATLTFLAALVHMPLANLSAILQVLPLAMTLAAALVFGERFGWRRMLAIAVGFAGVMMIVRPGTEGFDRWSVLGLLSVGCVVLRDLSTRGMSGALPTATVALGSAIAVTMMGWAGVALGGGWAPVGGRDAALLLLASAALFAGYLSSVAAMRTGEMSAIAPFRYTALVWAILFGYLTFGTLPDGWTLTGAALVVGSGLFALWRTALTRRRADGGAC